MATSPRCCATRSAPASLRKRATSAEASRTALLTLCLGATVSDELVCKRTISGNIFAPAVLNIANDFSERDDDYSAFLQAHANRCAVLQAECCPYLRREYDATARRQASRPCPKGLSRRFLGIFRHGGLLKNDRDCACDRLGPDDMDVDAYLDDGATAQHKRLGAHRLTV